MAGTEITLMEQRRIERIPIENIKVINSRKRDEEQFKLNVQSIESIGLQMPVRVNDKFLESSGLYELICGEGRLHAHKQLQKDTIEAEVVTCSRKQAYLESLVENIARGTPGTMDFAKEIKRLFDEGWDYDQIAKIACKSSEYIKKYIRLVECGEDRLIHGVEKGFFPITFAVNIAQSSAAEMQHILMDAFDQGIITTLNFTSARTIINSRLNRVHHTTSGDPEKYTMQMLTQDITQATTSKNSFVRQAKEKEGRLFLLLDGINALWRDPNFLAIAREENLINRPTLSGEYSYEQELGCAS
jgi:ParB family transcriptional regulator, chromosome partitioning protein